MKHCKKCDSINEESVNYCVKCGNKLRSIKSFSYSKNIIFCGLAILLVSGTSILAYSKYFQPKPKEEVRGETVAVEKKVEPYRCPDGNVSPDDGGVFNWDGSTTCVPNPDDEIRAARCASDLKLIRDMWNCPDTMTEETTYTPQYDNSLQAQYDADRRARELRNTIEEENRKNRDCLSKTFDDNEWNDYCY